MKTAKMKVPAASSHASKHEAEIERLRNENKWVRLREYVTSLTAKEQKIGNSDSTLTFVWSWVDEICCLFTEVLAKFCVSEADLEQYLFNNPINLPPASGIIDGQSAVQGAVPSQSGAKSTADGHNLYEVEQFCKETINKSEKNVSW